MGDIRHFKLLQISGVILLQCVGHVGDVMLVSTALSDAEKCCEILKDLQSAWPGARRCREIVSDLLFATTKRFAADRSGSETSADLSRDPSYAERSLVLKADR